MACNALRERAMRMLTQREHPRAELARKLVSHAASPSELTSLLDELTTAGLLSDQRYAQARLTARSPRFGDARLAYELRSSGVDGDVVTAALATIEDEISRASRLYERRFGHHGATSASLEQRLRQGRFLAGRGFSAETIQRVLGNLTQDENSVEDSGCDRTEVFDPA